MKKGILFTMLGLGDHIIHNGMARRMIVEKKLDVLYVLAWQHYEGLVKYMFRDDERIQVIGIGSGMEYHHSRHIISEVKPDLLYLLGHAVTPQAPFEDLCLPHTEYHQVAWTDLESRMIGGHQCYYHDLGMDWKYRFTDCYYQRDLREEERVFNKLNPNHEEYVFVQDDFRRGFNFNQEKVLELTGKDVKIIVNDSSENIFHYGLLLQNAKQIHLMESSFRCLVETIPTEGVEFYYHHYIRNNDRMCFDGKMAPDETRKSWNVVL